MGGLTHKYSTITGAYGGLSRSYDVRTGYLFVITGTYGGLTRTYSYFRKTYSYLRHKYQYLIVIMGTYAVITSMSPVSTCVITGLEFKGLPN